MKTTDRLTLGLSLLGSLLLTRSACNATEVYYPSSDQTRFQHLDFAEQVYCSRQTNKWITLAPGTAYIYKSPTMRNLNPGKHILRVHYCVGGPAEIEIKECREKPDCPSEFWHGLLVSTPIEITVNQESPTTGRTVPPKAGASGVQ